MKEAKQESKKAKDGGARDMSDFGGDDMFDLGDED